MQPAVVTICPTVNAYYYSLYLKGLFKTFEGARIRFSSKPFPRFAEAKLAFITQGREEVRFVVDAVDRAALDADALAWCNVYGKVNLLESAVPFDGLKMLALGPVFPIRFSSAFDTVSKALQSYLSARSRSHNVREHFANWYRQYRYSLPESDFTPGVSSDHYVFSPHTLWKGDPEVNSQRVGFFNACRSLSGLNFEGGFTPRTGGETLGFDRYMLSSRYSIQEYVSKTKMSAVAFNTPACEECHGFKLGVYLALGKAIISTPPKRELPAPLVNGEHVHLVDGSPDEIRESLRRLLGDRNYRAKLEAGARAYYDKYLKPRSVIGRLLHSGLVT